jgi:hypothetical protein
MSKESQLGGAFSECLTIRPEMAQSVSRSSVSRESVQASSELLKSLREKLWDTLEILAPRPLPASLDPVIVAAVHFRYSDLHRCSRFNNAKT